MSTDIVVSLSRRAVEAQKKALKAETFDEMMSQIINAYRLEQASSRIVYKDNPQTLKEDVEFWQKMIDVCHLAIAEGRKAWVEAQESDDPDKVLQEALDAFVAEHKPEFDMYLYMGQWWANVEY